MCSLMKVFSYIYNLRKILFALTVFLNRTAYVVVKSRIFIMALLVIKTLLYNKNIFNNLENSIQIYPKCWMRCTKEIKEGCTLIWKGLMSSGSHLA